MEGSINGNYVELINTVFFYILTKFSPFVLLITERGALTIPVIFVDLFVYFSCQFYELFIYFDPSLVDT